MILPPLPKLLELHRVRDLVDLTKRVYEWGTGVQDLLRAMRPLVQQILDGTITAASAASGGVTDHGALTGLGDDDHTQYLRTDGTRALTGNQAAGSNKITGLAAATANGDAVRYEQLPGLGSAVYDGRVIPAGLHAHSDEFSVDTVGGGSPTWTLWDPTAYATVAVNTTKRHVRFSSSPGGAATRHMGIWKSPPSNDFVFMAYISNDGFTTANAATAGLLVGQDFAGAPTTSDLYCIDFIVRRQGVSGAISVRAPTAYNNAAAVVSRNYEGPTFAWLAMAVRGIGGGTTDLEVYWSSDGVYWTSMATAALTYDVLNYGLYYFNPAAQSAETVAKHFRVFDGAADPYDALNGGYLTT